MVTSSGGWGGRVKGFVIFSTPYRMASHLVDKEGLEARIVRPPEIASRMPDILSTSPYSLQM